jgi:hypothetical protein
MNCDLVIFACEGREHLLEETYDTFKKNVKYSFNKTILSFDGEGGTWAKDYIKPDVFVCSPQRKGYVPSISRALHHVDADFFFWLEDDWSFLKGINLSDYINILKREENFSQIIFLKRRMSPKNKIKEVKDGIFTSRLGFSANPGLNRTRHVSEALQGADDSKAMNIEHFMTSYLEQRDLDCLVADPGDDIPYVEHLGYLEATGGKWHTMKGGKQSKDPPAFNDSELLFSPIRLLIRSAYLAGNTLFDEEARSLARRISNVVKIYKSNKSR